MLPNGSAAQAGSPPAPPSPPRPGSGPTTGFCAARWLGRKGPAEAAELHFSSSVLPERFGDSPVSGGSVAPVQG